MQTRRPDQLEIIAPDGQVQFVDLDPTLGILNVGSHPSNDLFLDSFGVEPFHGLIDYRAAPIRYVDLTRQPAPEEEDGAQGEALTHWRPLRIGPYELLLVPGNAGTSANPGPQTSPPPTLPSSSGTGLDLSRAVNASPPAPPPPPPAAAVPPPVRAPVREPSPNTLWIGPNQPGAHTLTIDNSGDRPADFQIGLAGTAGAWASLSAAQVSLAPGASQVITIHVAMPHPGGAPPGAYDLAWAIHSPQYPGWQNQGTLQVMVQAGAGGDWAVSELYPAEVRSAWLRQGGHTRFQVTNVGDAAISLLLRGQDSRGFCRVQFRSEQGKLPTVDRRGSAYRLDLPPYGEALITAAIRPDESRLVGVGTRSHRFAIHIVQAGDPNPQPRSLKGRFHSRPVIHLGLLALLLAGLLLAMILLFRQEIGRWVEGIVYPDVGVGEVVGMPTPAAIVQAVDLSRQPGIQTGGPIDGGDESYRAMFEEIGRLYNIDWRQLASQAHRESRLDPRARGRAGEYGLMQIMPGTWDEWAPLVQVTDPWDPYSNITVGAAYYAFLRSYFADLGYTDPRWALAAYNWGPERIVVILDQGGNWQRVPLMQRQYVADIVIGMDQAPRWVEEADNRRVSGR